ncbi:MAG: glycosyltransferase [Spirochaetes bacterium]|nr:glycosyltransferase [Spirochaetota bacterium]
MKILFDFIALQPSQGKFHGAGEYGKAVLYRLLEKIKEEKIDGFFRPDEWFDPQIKELLVRHSINLFPVNSNKEISDVIRSGNYDVIYSALPYKLYDLDLSNTEFIFTLHGLRELEMPTDRYEYKYYSGFESLSKYIFKNIFRQYYIKMQKVKLEKLLQSKSKNRHVIVDSNHTKYSVLNFFPNINSTEIDIFYPPVKQYNDEITLKQEKETLDKFNTSKDEYFLIISGNRWVKNSYRAIKAFNELLEEIPDFDKKVLVIGVESIKKFKKYFRKTDKIILHDYVETSELEILYKNAFCFVYPSLNEGFGYPPLECMKFGTPVICSAISSITEICGDSVIYFNPFRIDEIKNRILFILFDEKSRKEYGKLGRSRYEKIFHKQKKDVNEICNIILNN